MQLLICHNDLFSQFIGLKTAMGKRTRFCFSAAQRALYTKNYVRFVNAGDINLSQKHCSATLRTFVCLTVTCRSTHTECVVVFPLQQWLREGATVLRYTYTDMLFCISVTQLRNAASQSGTGKAKLTFSHRNSLRDSHVTLNAV